MSKPNRFSVVEGVKYVGKTVVRDHETGKLYDAEIKFVGTGINTTVGNAGREASVEVLKQDNDSLWEMVIFNEDENN